MTLEEAIAAHGKANLTETNDCYQWPINLSYLPAGVVLPKGNYYAQNVALKLKLNDLYSSADNQRKKEILYYYIAIWGGIRKNTDQRIRSYALDTPASLISKGSRGIASWSKALCIRCPNDYAIYDARVALSLNCLQIVKAIDCPMKFPLLNGQNKLINQGSRKVLQYATEHGWPALQEDSFYQKYNNTLSSSAKLLNVNLYTLEMLLFAKAPVLLQEAFIQEKF
jgi:hypothetical protein